MDKSSFRFILWVSQPAHTFDCPVDHNHVEASLDYEYTGAGGGKYPGESFSFSICLGRKTVHHRSPAAAGCIDRHNILGTTAVDRVYHLHASTQLSVPSCALSATPRSRRTQSARTFFDIEKIVSDCCQGCLVQ